MAAFEIPLISLPQKFDVDLAGVTYGMRFYWCAPGESWMMDVADNDGVPLVQGIPLNTGADLLAPYAYLGFGGQLIVETDFNRYAPPTSSNLGSQSHLYFVTT